MLAAAAGAAAPVDGVVFLICLGAFLGYLAAQSLGGSTVAKVIGFGVFGLIAYPMLALLVPELPR